MRLERGGDGESAASRLLALPRSEVLEEKNYSNVIELYDTAIYSQRRAVSEALLHTNIPIAFPAPAG